METTNYQDDVMREKLEKWKQEKAMKKTEGPKKRDLGIKRKEIKNPRSTRPLSAIKPRSTIKQASHSSPSMRQKLEEWKAKKQLSQKRETSVIQPFRCGRSSSTSYTPLKTPGKASNRINLLIKPNLSKSEIKPLQPTNSALRQVHQQSKTCFKPKKNTDERRKSAFLPKGSDLKKRSAHKLRRETFSFDKRDARLNKVEDVLKVQLDFEEKENDNAKSFIVVPVDDDEISFSLNFGDQNNQNTLSKRERSVRRETFDLTEANKVLQEHTCSNQKKQKAESAVDDKSLYFVLRETDVKPKTVLSMRDKLEQWLAAKGRTPRRVSRLISTPRVKRRKSNTLEISHEGTVTIEDTIQSCKQMLHEGCPPKLLLDWLSELKLKIPELTTMPVYLNFYEDLQKSHDDCPREEHSAVEVQGQHSSSPIKADQPSTPVHVLSKPPKSVQKSRRRTRTALTPVTEGSPASQIKFHLKEATPYFQRIQSVSDCNRKTPSTMVVTPVRRSMRLSKRRSMMTPAEAEDCVHHLSDIPIQQTTQLILRSNKALEFEFNVVE